MLTFMPHWFKKGLELIRIKKYFKQFDIFYKNQVTVLGVLICEMLSSRNTVYFLMTFNLEYIDENFNKQQHFGYII